MTVVNSKLNAVQAQPSATQNTTFVNCNICKLYTANFSATIINSIVQSASAVEYTTTVLNSSVILNSLINTYYRSSSYPFSIGSSSVTQNCYSESKNVLIISSTNCECAYDTSTLQSKGYLGSDGTVVGIYGGETPFTLVPSVPTVTSSDLKLDNENKQLNVKLTVSPQ